MNNVKKLMLNSPLLIKHFDKLSNPPKQLYYCGELENCLNQPRLAIVGSRKLSQYGRAVTSKLAREASEQGITIVSGLALGIDGVAHQATIEARGKTIAVLPSGLDKIYPASHHHLANQLIDSGGALVSEYESSSTYAFKGNFIARNRIISALSDAVLLIEATAGSGSLHTAGFAKEQGKLLLAVPGPITSPQSEGTNNLIKQGAIPITNVNDILSAMGMKRKLTGPKLLGDTPEQTVLLQLIYDGVSNSSALLAASKLDLQIFNQTLTMLEITGKISPVGPGRWGLS